MFLVAGILCVTSTWGVPTASQGFLFAFTGALELIPFGASSDLRWNFPAGTLELIPFGVRSDRLLGFAIPGDSFSGIPPCFPPVGVYSDCLFVGNYISPRCGCLILLLSWGTPSTLLYNYNFHPSFNWATCDMGSCASPVSRETVRTLQNCDEVSNFVEAVCAGSGIPIPARLTPHAVLLRRE